jgi:hypothetical protein
MNYFSLRIGLGNPAGFKKQVSLRPAVAILMNVIAKINSGGGGISLLIWMLN